MIAAFGAILATLIIFHSVGDQWVQTHHQAITKGLPSIAGRIACFLHVWTYTATLAVGLVLLRSVTGMRIDPDWYFTGLWISAVSHYVIDRRAPLYTIARWVGKLGYIDGVTVVRTAQGVPQTAGPGTGAFELDKSLHYLFLFLSALAMAQGASL